MFKLAVFDMDGTLLDTIDDLADACNHALRECGYPTHPTAAYKRFVGNGTHNLILRALGPESDTVSAEKVETVFRLYYKAHANDRTRPYSDIPEMLRMLRDRGMRTAILSNKTHDYVVSLAEFHFPGLFDLVLGQREGIPLKPDPAALREILDHFQLSPEECAYVGDSGVDMETGMEAGLHTIGVSWGFRPKDELEKWSPMVIVDKVETLFDLLVDK